jgi:hypothetical protein
VAWVGRNQHHDEEDASTCDPTPEQFRELIEHTKITHDAHLARLMRILDPSTSTIPFIDLGTIECPVDESMRFAYRLNPTPHALKPTLDPWRTGRRHLPPCVINFNIYGGSLISTVVQVGRLEYCRYETILSSEAGLDLEGRGEKEVWTETDFVLAVEVDDQDGLISGGVFAVCNPGVVGEEGYAASELPGEEGVKGSVFKLADKFEDLGEGKVISVEMVDRGGKKLCFMPLLWVPV